jgi:hypothetical protein
VYGAMVLLVLLGLAPGVQVSVYDAGLTSHK